MKALRRVGGRSTNQPKFTTSPAIQRDELRRPTTRTKNVTQEDQDQEDEEHRREAMRDLVESWMDRLQLISVITTFFASTEASMITITAPSQDGTPMTIASQFANIGIMGALIVHSNVAIISFLAAFLLIRYKLKVAKDEELEIVLHTGSKKGNQREIVESPSVVSFDHDINYTERMDREHTTPSDLLHNTDPIPGMIRISSPLSPNRPVFSKNPHLVQVGPFESHPPTHILSRCHTLCIFLTVLGFVLALMGMLCFAWDRLPPSVSIPSSFFMALCVISGLWIWFKPVSTKGRASHIYYTGQNVE